MLAKSNIKSENTEIIEAVSNKIEKHCKKINNALEKQEKKEKKKKARLKKKRYESQWESIGSCRITTYCPGCNDPAGSYQSSSGATLYEGCVACSWLPIGTVLRINGNEYVVMDRCGTDAIDIFLDTSYCTCNQNYYTNVEVKK